ncbi:MAG TPA: tetratricopeptide repeat protein, partial [Candidatus Polarisedimenticolaceae bacterium]|nr:tetratricopeptide repeat protein [Candidatus Polarisedimenticolaceae bacterium]
LAVATWRRNPVWNDNATLALTDVRSMPRSAKLQAGAGLARADAGDRPGAEAAFRRAIEIYPDYAQMRYNLAVLLEARGANQEALEQAGRAAELAPGNARSYKLLGPLLERAGRRREALTAYEAGIRLDPPDRWLRFYYGCALRAEARAAPATDTFDALARENPSDLAGTLAQAMLLEARGETERARAVYRWALTQPGLPAAAAERLRTLLTAR